MVAEIQQHGMGLLADFVPNHMGIGQTTNGWWMDVLENGPSSLTARCFDINWHPLKAELENKVLLPILGEQYGRVLENGELTVSFEGGTFYLHYYDTKLPINPRTYNQILGFALEALKASREPGVDVVAPIGVTVRSGRRPIYFRVAEHHDAARKDAAAHHHGPEPDRRACPREGSGQGAAGNALRGPSGGGRGHRQGVAALQGQRPGQALLRPPGPAHRRAGVPPELLAGCRGGDQLPAFLRHQPTGGDPGRAAGGLRGDAPASLAAAGKGHGDGGAHRSSGRPLRSARVLHRAPAELRAPARRGTARGRQGAVPAGGKNPFRQRGIAPGLAHSRYDRLRFHHPHHPIAGGRRGREIVQRDVREVYRAVRALSLAHLREEAADDAPVAGQRHQRARVHAQPSERKEPPLPGFHAQRADRRRARDRRLFPGVPDLPRPRATSQCRGHRGRQPRDGGGQAPQRGDGRLHLRLPARHPALPLPRRTWTRRSSPSTNSS